MSTRKYELVYVVSPDVGDDQVSAVHEQVQAIVARFGGEIERTDTWGRRKLAYEIAHHKEGTYVLEVINGGGVLTVQIEKEGCPPAQRQVEAGWRDWAVLDDVVLVPFDAAATVIASGAPALQTLLEPLGHR